VVNKNNWNEATIKSRAEWLSNKANLIWKNVISAGEEEEEEIENVRRQLDHTQYSLGGGDFTSKSTFVFNSVKAYAQKHSSTVDELKQIFKGELLKNFKRIGFICTREDIEQKTLSNGRKPSIEEKHRWYHCNDADVWLIDSAGVEYVVSSEITKYSANAVKDIMEKDGFAVATKQS